MDVYALSITIIQLFLGMTIEEFKRNYPSIRSDKSFVKSLSEKGIPEPLAKTLVQAISAGRSGKLDKLPNSEKLLEAFGE